MPRVFLFHLNGSGVADPEAAPLYPAPLDNTNFRMLFAIRTSALVTLGMLGAIRERPEFRWQVCPAKPVA
jgi:hypothetical protein